MPIELVWVNKTAASDSLSQSSGHENTSVRRHAQISKRKRVSRQEKPSSQDVGIRPLLEDASADQSVSTVWNTATKSYSRQAPLSATWTSACSVRRYNHSTSIPTSLDWQTLELSCAERRSLDFFQHRTAQDWAGWQDASFWSGIALQLGHHNRAVAHSLVSLSALHERLEYACDDGRRACLDDLSLLQRDKAVKSAASAQHTTHADALVSCMVLLCLQNLQHGHHSFRLLQAGTRILDEYERGACSGSTSAQSENLLIAQHVRPLFDRIRGRLFMMADPARALNVSVTRKATTSYGEPMQLDIPNQFTSTLQARNVLQDILFWAHNMLAAGLEDRLFAVLRVLVDSWFVTLNNTSRSESTPKEALTRNRLLNVARLFSVMLLETFRATDETIYDEYMDDFTEIIRTAEVVTSRSTKTSFGIDNGLVDIVGFVGQHCRDPVIRRQALGISTRSGRVEGGRLAYIAGAILGETVRLEEQGLSVKAAGDIPESHRVRLWAGSQYFGWRKIRLVFRRSPYDDSMLGAQEEDVWVSLPDGVEMVDPSHDDCSSDLSTPDTVFGSGYVAFLDNRCTRSYYAIDSSPFFFPIPKM